MQVRQSSHAGSSSPKRVVSCNKQDLDYALEQWLSTDEPID
jgi:hypothetical protein